MNPFLRLGSLVMRLDDWSSQLTIRSRILWTVAVFAAPFAAWLLWT